MPIYTTLNSLSLKFSLPLNSMSPFWSVLLMVVAIFGALALVCVGILISLSASGNMLTASFFWIFGAIALVCVGIFVTWYKRRNKRRLRRDGFADEAPSQQPQPHLHESRDDQPPLHNLKQSAPLLNVISSNSQSSSSKSTNPIPDILAFTKTRFTFEELELATGNFSSTNLLGQGGFGYVHKGVLSDGREVAIKQLKVGSGQGESEFQAEVNTISRVHHKHLVSLVGHCISGTRRLLVYEYVPNGSLESHLRGMGKPPLNWGTRMKIAIGSAKGLSYLHEDCHPRIIHRDIKSANILLDENFVVKLADFGLARFFSEADTHVTTRVIGTFGYLAPEYAFTGKLTDKSDVFSFGVVLLELITGHRPIDTSQKYFDDNIIDWARPLLTQALESDNFNSVADPRLQKVYNSIEMARMVACASACVRRLVQHRPRMSQIFHALEGRLPLDELNEGVQPGHGTIYDSTESSDYDTKQYRDDLIKFRKMALESTQVTTSEV